MIWGDQPPYKDSVKIVDGNKLWFVRLKKTDVGHVLADGFTKVVRDSCIRKNNYLMFQSFGQSSFFLMVFKSFVHQYCFISKITPDKDVIVSSILYNQSWLMNFGGNFMGKNFKGGQSTLYLGDRFWNVKMDGLTDSCVFTHGCSKMVNDLALDSRSIFVFSMVGNKIFELSVFYHQTSTQIQNNKVELVVLDDSIYGDDGDDLVIASEHKEKCSTAETDFQESVVVECEDDKFQLASFESVFNDIDDSKFDNFFSSLLEMEDLKKKVDPTRKTNIFISEPSLSSIVVSDATQKCKAVMLVSDESLIAHRTRSKFRNKNESVVVDKFMAAETTSVSRKRSTLKRSKTISTIEFTKVAENRMRLPSAISDELSLSFHNLRDVSIQNIRCEVTNMKTIAEKNGDGYRYGFSKWSAFLKSNQIHMALLFSLNMSSLRSF
ncbi:putative transcription factor B3-Domain family [Helianthus annuus]|uniref:Transcription factor B3-Domain family n=2 Tax=Helianthus annuus TaxID=4232 RepID=A0A9K3MXZ9_HELAN|nr:putative transcription factor B3-Domain family [Helianthus annuus]KAJ0864064.1 putative transcription factor B3-Domain family [Helianthus annuus]